MVNENKNNNKNNNNNSTSSATREMQIGNKWHMLAKTVWRNPCIHWWYTTTAEIRMEVPPNSKTEATIWQLTTASNVHKALWVEATFRPSWPLLTIYTKPCESAHHRRFLHIHVYCRMIHESQAVKSTSMSFTRWMGAESVAYRHNGVLFGRKEAWNHAFAGNGWNWWSLCWVRQTRFRQISSTFYHW